MSLAPKRLLRSVSDDSSSSNDSIASVPEPLAGVPPQVPAAAPAARNPYESTVFRDGFGMSTMSPIAARNPYDSDLQAQIGLGTVTTSNA